MQLAKKLLMIAGAMALVAMASLAVLPGAAHAATALLVNVVNSVTVANPQSRNGEVQPLVTTDIDGLWRQPYQDACVGGSAEGATGPNQFTCQLSPVPSGERLVIQEVTALCLPQYDGEVDAVNLATSLARGTRPSEPHQMVLVRQLATDGTLEASVVSETVHLYADSSGPSVFTFRAGTDGSCQAGVSGYLEPDTAPIIPITLNGPARP